MGSNESLEIIKRMLAKYILVINDDYTKDELLECDMYSLVTLYCNSYSIPFDCFYDCLASLVKKYKEENPDEIVSDEDIYAATDAFSPVDHFGFAMMYFETLKADLAKKLNDANDNFFRCIKEVKLETERLNTARTSMEISEIRSDIACANIAMHKAKTHESSVLAQVKNVQENYEKLLKSMQQYYVNLNENLDESDYLNLIRDNKPGKPE